MNTINLADYTYHLPDHRIALFPVEPREHSKLLVYQQGQITHARFDGIRAYLPAKTCLVFNNSRVIPARIFFQKPSGATIEILLLHPIAPTTVIQLAMQNTEPCVWECMIGNKKRWKNEVIFCELDGTTLSAELVDSEKNHVRFQWKNAQNTAIPFVEIIQAAGQIPLPPYLNRDSTPADLESYQTVYAKQKGAVAAPTAGLHFTENILQNLKNQGVNQEFLTLHVGAGTFQPIKVENIATHQMHCEQVVYSQANIENLLQNLGNIIPVGTTSMRALESLYWLGVEQQAKHGFMPKLFPYQHQGKTLPTPKEALEAVLEIMKAKNQEELVVETEIFIFPGYDFKLCKGLITNFHQPNSTLILLVAALLGNDWQRVYDQALNNDYRFLSYGDSSLLLPN